MARYTDCSSIKVAPDVDLAEVDTLLNKKSGMLGLTGKTDMRDIKALIEDGDQDAKLGLDVYVHRLVGYIGSYIAFLGGIDAIIFTAGVGENADHIRKMVVERLGFFGVTLDEQANAVRSKEPRRISTEDSRWAVLVVPTNEELAMVRETVKAIGA